MRFVLTIAALVALSACAKRPDAIAPVSMGNVYERTSCREAQTLLNAERQTMAALSTAQNNAATGDAVGVFLIGVPMSSVGGGDKAGEIATSKGKIVALENRMVTC